MTDQQQPKSIEYTPLNRQGRSPLWLRLLEQYALVLLIAVIFVFFSTYSKSSQTFPTINNWNVILGGVSVVSLIAVGALFPMVCGYFDFSMGANAAMAQVMCAGFMIKNGAPLWLAVVLAVLLSSVVGVLNGLFVTKFNMSPFVTTLGMGMLLSGMMVYYTGGTTLVSGIDRTLFDLGSSRVGGLPSVFFVTLAFAGVAWYFFTHTPFGRSLYAIGSNATAAKLVGVPLVKNVWFSLITAGFVAGCAGVMNLARQGSAIASDGNYLLFPALAAVFLGATAIRPGFMNVIGTLLGAILVSMSVSGLALSGAGGWASNVFNGAALIIAVGLSTYLGHRKRAGGTH